MAIKSLFSLVIACLKRWLKTKNSSEQDNVINYVLNEYHKIAFTHALPLIPPAIRPPVFDAVMSDFINNGDTWTENLVFGTFGGCRELKWTC
jgi:hypothetical protein|mmetsp:Transcript_59243/g.98261  ORF Transcript_59243/g.98261 Transcript_59243/m.98261 type:complete len:92 (-) Transcript_59243:359-634(-)